MAKYWLTLSSGCHSRRNQRHKMIISYIPFRVHWSCDLANNSYIYKYCRSILGFLYVLTKPRHPPPVLPVVDPHLHVLPAEHAGVLVHHAGQALERLGADLDTLLLEHAEDLLQVDVEAVEEGPLGREVLDDEGGASAVYVGGEGVPPLPRLQLTERQDLGHQEGFAVFGEAVDLG